jgi:hypothetical protein
LTSGTLFSDRINSFTNINVELGGPDFALLASNPVNSFYFPPGGEQYVPGTEVEFDGGVGVGMDIPDYAGTLTYGGVFYPVAVGDIGLDTGAVPVVAR